MSDTDSAWKFCIAPMIDWTDRHCRFFHRQITRGARLYTEMIVADAILRGDRDYLLGFDAVEHPVALQLGGSDPATMAAAARIGADYGYDEININVGCPSDRVQSGAFGACLMREPQLVADCFSAMADAVDVPVTVKCRIGVDDQDPEEVLPGFVDLLAGAGCKVFIIHARKAWLQGLSPKANRTIPPLDYDLVYRLKQARADLTIVLNGGITEPDAAAAHLERIDGVMIGRAAYENPSMLGVLDGKLLGLTAESASRRAVVEAMAAYIERQAQNGVRPHNVARHMLGLFHGQPGARRWRQMLTVEGTKPDADASVLLRALDRMPAAALEGAA
ncbi:tRNA dihydrouridine(20/20a) synthase DusA [Aquisalinus flavus]|uniref:tRNA-dihydrouridine(20/20a) synthase n=1 Tax=Aquisalinus flavus TaxID=1526572 RepID=A0A8J2V419_9PROT|nr:tRNA dihydrouridine(20/20a) synthase DusA [Aquisalinus flavus]MBD0427167.1 tRNA dihydrouridine(20/20a) synthase DusA [Aquisalinus flavus]UNE46984.1 tRNA dihydrouridine(20/20a) synthase DusA [Aquisalinus flavus]GGC98888.1 tRNA-dihydrouridine(20/20a) synthase [Aquisalinus flavus]